MKRTVLALVFLLIAHAAFAQTATPASQLAWDEVGESVAQASAATYHYYVDGATTPIAAANVVCSIPSGSSMVTCQAALPPLTPGTHTILITQVVSGVESPKSAPFGFAFVVVVVPTNVRIIG